MDDNKGTSLVIIHSKKGAVLIKTLSSSIVAQEIDMDTVLRFNPALIQSSKNSIHREALFEQIDSCSIDELVNNLFPIKIKSRIKSCLSKIGISELIIKFKAKVSRRTK